ncbi:MAG: hypothetical protein VXX85_07365, partial [Candidatus Margulisiibacteriota bacterium]|nr:hypothetical protein [Candidatus Margulisiibacteriota bacterium]
MTLLHKTLAFNHSELDLAVRKVLKSKEGTYEHFHYLYGNNELMVFCIKETSFLFKTFKKPKQYLFNLKNRTVVKVTHGSLHHTTRSYFNVDKIQSTITEKTRELLSHSSEYKPGISKIQFIYNAICKIASLFSNIPDLKNNSVVYPDLHLSPVFKNTMELPIQSIKNDVRKILESKTEELTYSDFSIKKKSPNHINNDRKFFKKVNPLTSLSLIIDGEGSADKFTNAENIMTNLKNFLDSHEFDTYLNALSPEDIHPLQKKLEEIINTSKSEANGMVTMCLIIAKNNTVYSFYKGDTHSFLYNGTATIWLTPNHGECINIEAISKETSQNPHYTYNADGIPPERDLEWELNASSYTTRSDYTVTTATDGVFDLFLYLVGRNLKKSVKINGKKINPTLLLYDFNLVSSYFKIANGDPSIITKLFKYHAAEVLSQGKLDDRTMISFKTQIEASVDSHKSATSVWELPGEPKGFYELNKASTNTLSTGTLTISSHDKNSSNGDLEHEGRIS